ncbi:Os07g0228300 [Oryza sativa Japonica Group]|uniref:Os07g0228300 protein n=1 Tax=Oryza sativa subsp. japonica TaxID=39947 RepID=A0A0P0X4F0_ORYSJ|nr:Os07g0228300 [Oryza sativa Japonica Group]
MQRFQAVDAARADPPPTPGSRRLFVSLSRGSAVGGDRRGGSGDLFPSRTDPVISPPSSRADPPLAAMGGVDPATSSLPAWIRHLFAHTLTRVHGFGGAW